MPNTLSFRHSDMDDHGREIATGDLVEGGYTRTPLPLDRTMINALSRLSAAAWTLPIDQYYDGGVRHRSFNRYRVKISQETIDIRSDEQDTPYFQHEKYNTTLGGIDRRYPPLPPDVSLDEGLCKMICMTIRRLPLARKIPEFAVNLHLMRFSATPGQLCDTSPPGYHKDGERYIGVTMLTFCGCNGGEVHIADNDKTEREHFTLREMGESYLIDDEMVWHKLSPVEVGLGAKFAIRDTALFDFMPVLDT